ncbi:hypothetical protein T484DRAFT_1776036 [Baffinella frigidus]|nr:hypothetical protein T484DRAFT_1776036 [Cryptophyta sp. CCMP2293]
MPQASAAASAATSVPSAGTRVVALAMLAGSAAAWHVGGGAAFAPLSSGPGTSACLRRGGDNARLCARSATRGGAPLETRMGAPLDTGVPRS